MKLADFLSQYSIKRSDFAESLGVTVQALERYVNGKRVPRDPRIIQRLFDATEGKVTLNDFYDINRRTGRVSKVTLT